MEAIFGLLIGSARNLFCAHEPSSRTMRFVSLIASAIIALAAAINNWAQTPPAASTNALPPQATAATANLFTADLITLTNLALPTNAIVRNLGLMEAIQLSLTNNYDVRIDSYSPEIAKTDVEAAKGAYDPVLGVTGEHASTKDDTRRIKSDNVSVGLGTYLPTGGTLDFAVNANESRSDQYFPTNRYTRAGQAGATVINARQPLLRNLWIDPTRYNIQISRKNLQISELSFRTRLLSTVSLVEQAYFEWVAARENVRVQQEALTLARQQAAEYRTRVQIGVSFQLDEQRLASQAATSEANLLTALRQLRERRNTMINLIATDFEAWRDVALVPADELPTIQQAFDAQTSWSQAFAHRPDLHQLIIDLERLGLTEKLQYNQLFPSLDLIGSYGYNAFGDSFRGGLSDLADANKPFWSVGLTASFPIGNRIARANLKGTRLAKDQANERLKQARQTIMVQVENAIADARTSWERIPATRQAREFAAAALEGGRVRLTAGAATSLEILTLQRDLTSARSDEIRALVDYNRAVTILLEREGTLLEARHLNVNVH